MIRAILNRALRRIAPRSAYARRLLSNGRPPVVVRSFTEVLPYALKAEVLLTDMFDTLVARQGATPEEVIRRVCARFSLLMATLGRDGDAPTGATLYQAREAAVGALRQRRLERHPKADPEFTLDELLQEWLSPFAEARGIPFELTYWREEELLIELSFLEAKPGVADTLQQLKQRGIPVVVISDMYMDAAALWAILQKCGLASYIADLHVSSESRRGKYSGKLFEQVVSGLAANRTALLHIGDNLWSDGIAPARLGIQSVWLAESKPSTLAALDPACGVESSLGYSLAPSIIQYVEHTLRFAIERQAAVFFLARDGALFHRIATHLLAHSPAFAGVQVKTCYLKVSRLAVTLPCTPSIDELLQLAVNRGGRHLTIQDVFATAGLGLAELAHVLAEHQVSGSTFVFGAHPHASTPMAPAVVAFLADSKVRLFYNDAHLAARAGFEQYLTEAGFLGADRAVLADIGWNGSIQRMMVSALSAHPKMPQTEGLYYGTTFAVNAPVTLAPRHVIHPGVCLPISDAGGTKYRFSALGLIPLFEVATAAHEEPSVARYSAQGLHYKESIPESPLDSQAARELQRAIWEYLVQRHLQNPGLFWGASVEAPGADKGLNQLILRPTREQVQRCSQLTLDLGWGSDERAQLVRPESLTASGWRASLHGWRSYWRYGALYAMGGLPRQLAQWPRCLRLAHKLAYRMARVGKRYRGQ